MIATNIEQGKRLMEAGLRTESADMCWARPFAVGCKKEDIPPMLYAEPYCSADVAPAWSLGRLWDLMLMSHVAYDYSTYESAEYVIASLVEALVRLAKHNSVKYENTL